MSQVVMVWFRADRAHDGACAERLSALGRRMAGAHGVEARSGWRDEPGYRTWLETYEPLDAGSPSSNRGALQAAAKELGLDALATGGRHVEVFEWSA